MGISDVILDAALIRQVSIGRYSRRVEREVLELLRQVEADIVARLATGDVGQQSIASLETTLSAVRAVIEGGAADLRALLEAELRGLAADEAEFVAEAIARGVEVPGVIDVARPSPESVWSAALSRPFQGRFLAEWVAGWAVGTQTAVRDAVRIGIVEGTPTAEIVDRVLTGPVEASRRSITAVVRTAITHYAAVAREVVAEANERIVRGVRWVSTLDGRTSPVCRARDGQVFPLREGPRPPAHPNCRSTTVPVLRSWRELGINADDLPQRVRASMDGTVPGDLTYEDWLKRQPREFQDEVLGPTRARLWRDGGLDLGAFVDESGREYTLDELRRSHADAFRAAGL